MRKREGKESNAITSKNKRIIKPNKSKSKKRKENKWQQTNEKILFRIHKRQIKYVKKVYIKTAEKLLMHFGFLLCRSFFSALSPSSRSSEIM